MSRLPAWTGAALALLGAVLPCCGEPPPPPAAIDAAHLQTSAPGADLTPLERAALAARGGLPATDDSLLPAGLRHFQLQGQARFVMNDASRTIEQELEIALAGPELQRYQLASASGKNWFLLGGPGEAWLKTPRETTPQAYPDGAAELGEDAALRWLVLRFPASVPPAQRTAWSAAWQAGERLPVLPDQGRGAVSLELDEEGLPARFWRLPPGSAEAGEAQLLLELRDWTLPRAAAPDGNWRYPALWVWSRAQWRVEEQLQSIEDRALYLDLAFRPEDAPLSSYRVQRDADGSAVRAPAERLALVRWELRGEALPAAPAQRTTAPGESRLWAKHDGADLTWFREASTEDAPLLLTDQLCLLWSSPDPDATRETGLEQLRTLAAQNRLRILGASWATRSVGGFDLLVPVERESGPF